MADVFDKLKRAEVMSKIRGRGNKSTELALALAFKRARVSGWRRHVLFKPFPAISDQKPGEVRRLSIRPDFVFYRHRTIVFVDGCFWHGCPAHATRPGSNAEFWDRKLAGNIARDRRAERALEAAGWKVIRFWEHELKHPDVVVLRLIKLFTEVP